MKWAGFFACCIWAASCQCKNEDPVGVLDAIINATLESLRPQLANLYLKKENFETGPQELGNFRGSVAEVKVEGLEKFIVKKLKTSLLNIKNLTIVEKDIYAKGFYKLNGTLAFPLGKNDIHFFGDGEFRAKFHNFSVSLKLKICFENGLKVVKDFDVFVGLEKMQIYLENLMGGGELEDVFNEYMNDVGLTVFNYYKEPILCLIKPKIIHIIMKLLNQHKNEKINKLEL